MTTFLRRWFIRSRILHLLIAMGAVIPLLGAAGPNGYVVRPGQTLSGISQETGVPVRCLAAWNDIANEDQILAGQFLKLHSPPAPTDHRGSAPAIRQRASSNFWRGHPHGPPIALVLHTADGSLVGMDAWFRNPDSRVSTHFAVGRRGEIHQYVPLEHSAWGNGILEPGHRWPGPVHVSPNWRSISIETEGRPLEPVTDAQYQATLWLVQQIQQRYPIKFLLGHSAIAPQSRASDPGPRWLASGRLHTLAAATCLEPIA